MPGSWKRKRILSERKNVKQLEKCDSSKVAKYSSSNVYGVNWRVNITILTKPILSQSFPKCSDFNICAENVKQKKGNTSIEGKGKSTSNIIRSK